MNTVSSLSNKMRNNPTIEPQNLTITKIQVPHPKMHLPHCKIQSPAVGFVVRQFAVLGVAIGLLWWNSLQRSATVGFCGPTVWLFCTHVIQSGLKMEHLYNTHCPSELPRIIAVMIFSTHKVAQMATFKIKL